MINKYIIELNYVEKVIEMREYMGLGKKDMDKYVYVGIFFMKN